MALADRADVLDHLASASTLVAVHLQSQNAEYCFKRRRAATDLLLKRGDLVPLPQLVVRARVSAIGELLVKLRTRGGRLGEQGLERRLLARARHEVVREALDLARRLPEDRKSVV